MAHTGSTAEYWLQQSWGMYTVDIRGTDEDVVLATPSSASVAYKLLYECYRPRMSHYNGSSLSLVNVIRPAFRLSSTSFSCRCSEGQSTLEEDWDLAYVSS